MNEPSLHCTQAAAIVLSLAGGAMDRGLLVKVLKRADELALQTVEKSTMGSNLEWSPAIWQEGDVVRLNSDPGDSELSDFDIDVLTQAFGET